jgi:hypothetical protein
MHNRWLRVDLAAQTLEVFEGDDRRNVYLVSTALKGAGERIGSEQTPRGTHEVKALIGAGSVSGAVFIGRQPTGEVYSASQWSAQPGRDWILSRIVWLSGLEQGRNLGGEVDTCARFIYIHGTPDEEPMGEPRSHGCIRMRNAALIELFDLLEEGTRVQIDG